MHDFTDGLWIPEGPGKWSRPLSFDVVRGTWVELMRLLPGTSLGRHRHSGPVHAFNLRGERLLSDGRHVKMHDYVFEPDGNVDWWGAVGEEELVVFVSVGGAVEYLDEQGEVTLRITAEDRYRDYVAYCQERGLEPLLLPRPLF
ncbi:MAG TPA: hypothetical protein VKP60_13355 [Magnetospirillaceae bacterium]|nr:hypothetical protein [Magnetospirillaceae bacterium]